MRLAVLLCLILTVAGCATPRQSCEARATRDLRVVDNLIGDLQATLRRGYDLERETVVRRRLVTCRDRAGYRRSCLRPVRTTILVPEAVDLGEERDKLASLIAKRDELRARSVRAVAACRAAYPAG